jgi:hypothetical protein
MALITAVTAFSASALLISDPSCFFTDSTNSTLFMDADGDAQKAVAPETFTGADSRADAFVRSLSTELARFVNLEAHFFPKICANFVSIT